MMGGVLTKVRKAVVKPIMTINIEERAHKVINKAKPTPAPTYPSTQKQIEIAKQVNPNFMEEHYIKDPKLDEKLRQVYVSSYAQHAEAEKSEKLLPKNTRHSREWDYGFWEPEKAPEGMVLLGEALKFMSDHITDPKTNDVQKIATQYKLDDRDVRNILEYYRVFQVITPPKETRGMALSQPSPRELLKNITK